MSDLASAGPEVRAALEVAAAALARARLEGVRLPSLPDANLPSSLAQGFAIQQQVGPLAGKTVGGWKCALPPAGKWIVAPIYSDSIVKGERYPLAANADKARIEPELACVLAHDLPARVEPYTAAQIVAAISEVRMALEVIDCRYTDPQTLPFEQLLADGLFNHGLVLGEAITLPDSGRMPSELDITLRDATTERLNIKGRHPDGDPLLPIIWLANFLSTQGIGLQAGQVVITGSYAGVLDVPVNQPLHVQFGKAGSLSVHFSTLEE
ncbi:2-keto-4-pentenoate hydratase [Pseudomonas amygdali]|uniref:2-keto-4-pentenoate hydratase n=1 Tax=Pseudomonas amygdali TaxID=47877 RepID=UPI0006B978E7|nr:fumarylacetoacetate hydrolase family protein [Pseudomonas amygdali]KPB22146.1 2-keto-4-pentenoate hydratase [Pseudomonas amygdali pv. sesami]KPY58747.1 2-keto-4-pentenoate hydratase [Pseudomonas amygdali pv. sesami]RMT87699.1 2-keto-4-pentenoate hydratase [Pseudomonas amygdali pv. sesami]RMT93996.1 2-keto-4-pentenoate hydratase [Pseudomonas amygdali pv. sesami]RMV84025.1 2-keto-4-pentenoate hydratase [Pseudomonas amygdali pv. sesami]